MPRENKAKYNFYCFNSLNYNNFKVQHNTFAWFKYCFLQHWKLKIRCNMISLDVFSPDMFGHAPSWMCSFVYCQWYDTPFVYLLVQTSQEKGWSWWISHIQIFGGFLTLRFERISHHLWKCHTTLFVCLAGRLLLRKAGITFHFYKFVIRVVSAPQKYSVVICSQNMI